MATSWLGWKQSSRNIWAPSTTSYPNQTQAPNLQRPKLMPKKKLIRFMPRRLLSLIIVSHKWTTKSKLKLTAKTKKVWMNRFRFLKSSNPKNLPINNKRTFRAKRRREICICISRISKTRMIHS